MLQRNANFNFAGYVTRGDPTRYCVHQEFQKMELRIPLTVAWCRTDVDSISFDIVRISSDNIVGEPSEMVLIVSTILRKSFGIVRHSLEIVRTSFVYRRLPVGIVAYLHVNGVHGNLGIRGRGIRECDGKHGFCRFHSPK